MALEEQAEKAKEEAAVFMEQFLRNKASYFRVRILGIENVGKELIRIESSEDRMTPQRIRESELDYQAKAPYFKESSDLSEGEVYLSDVGLDRQGEMVLAPHRPMIRAVAPIVDNNGDTFGLAVIDKDMKWVFDEFQALVPNGKLYMTNEQDEFIFHPVSDKAFRFDFGDSYTSGEEFNALNLESAQPTHILGDRVVSKKPTQIITNDRVKVFTIFVEHSLENIRTEITALSKKLFIYALIILSVVLLATLAFAKMFSKPLRSTQRFALNYRNDGGSTIGSRLPVHLRDEVGDLARSIEHMVRTIEDQTQAKQRVINELTLAKRDLESQALELQERKQEAEKASNVKSEFLMNMSHAIRKPVKGIISTIALLKKTVLSDDQNTYLYDIGNYSEGLFGFVKDILDLTQLGTNGLKESPMLIRDIMETIACQYETKIAEKDIHFQMRCAESLDSAVLIDPSVLEKILSHLVQNAIKFNHVGGRIEFSARADKDRLMIDVMDEGIGIPEDKQEMIFDAFTQVDGSSTREFGGIGLGLSISEKFA